MGEVEGAIREIGLIAILRGDFGGRWLEVGRALVSGGARVMEVAINSPHALEAIEILCRGLVGQAYVGAGTVLSVEEASACLERGARFLVSPRCDAHTVSLAKERGVPYLPGALSPGEILSAWERGASMVKLYPAMPLGPEYLRQLRGPLGHIPLVPTGGVSLANAAEFMAAGAVAVGVGGSLAQPSHSVEQIESQARALLERIASGGGGVHG